MIWRGPLLSNKIKQSWYDIILDKIDFMSIDMSPGTSDIPSTAFQSLPIDGIIVVTSPSELSSLIVSKAINMAIKMNIPIIGLIENRVYLKSPDNQKEYRIFSESHIDEIVKKYNLNILAKEYL